MAHYSLTIHEVTTTTANIWLGSLNQFNKKPEICQLFCYETKKTSNKSKPIKIKMKDWKRPFRDARKRFYFEGTFKNLLPGTHYTVGFEASFKDKNGTLKMQSVNEGCFDTLPTKLSKLKTQPFTVGLGSCFYPHYDGGHTARAYKALYESKDKPHISFLTGDQVYLDINLYFSLNKEDTRDRIADEYAHCWRELGGVLKHGGTWMVPDDHEFWNNYPVTSGANPYIWALKNNKKRDNDKLGFRDYWKRYCFDGVKNVQKVKPLKFFDIGSDLSFCVADFRSDRLVDTKYKPVQLMKDKDLNKLTKWIANLTNPAVLVLGQPLLDKLGSKNGDYSLANFTDQYKTLVTAIGACDHDIVILAGDVHFGRISEVKVGNGKGRIFEVISSPFSNLTGKDSIAVSTPDSHEELKKFPAISVPGITKAKIKRHKKVDSTGTYNPWDKKPFDFRYIKERTKEHFMTLSFNKSTKGNVSMFVQAWKVREIDNKWLPIKEFKKSASYELGG